MVVLNLGWLSFANALHSPAFATFSTSDVVRWVFAGVCFGAGAVGMVMLFRGHRPNDV